jgi:hypothetical protein
MSQSEGNIRHVTGSATGPKVGRNGAAFDLEPALKPEEDEADQRYEDVAPEDDAGIARLEIVLGDHRMDVDSGGALEKGGEAQDGGETHFEAPPCCNDTDQSQAQVREAERAYRSGGNLTFRLEYTHPWFITPAGRSPP